MYMRRQARKSLFSVMISNGRNDDDIARLTTQLEDAVRLFDVRLLPFPTLCVNPHILVSDVPVKDSSLTSSKRTTVAARERAESSCHSC